MRRALLLLGPVAFALSGLCVAEGDGPKDRPIAVGGMLVGASYTLFRMRKQLGLGISRAVRDLKQSAAGHESTNRTERDLNAKLVFAGP